MILPSRQVYDAGELTGAPAASVLVVPYVLVNPQHPNPRKTGGVIRCGLQARLDVGPHGVPRGCQLSSQASDGGSLEAQLSDRPADRPGPQTRPRCAHRVVLLAKGRDLAGGFGGVWVFWTVCFERVVLSSPGCLWPGRMDDHEEVLEAHA